MSLIVILCLVLVNNNKNNNKDAVVAVELSISDRGSQSLMDKMILVTP